MWNFIRKGVARLNNYINKEIGVSPDNLELLAKEVTRFLHSPERLDMLKAYEYYNDNQDILRHKRTMINEDGDIEEVTNVKNYKVIDNMYATHVDKKVSYLTGNKFAIKTDNDAYTDVLDEYFDLRLRNKIKMVCGDMVKCGVGYLHPYYKDNELKFKRFKPYEVKVYYADDEKEEIDFFFRHYTNRVYTRGYNEEFVEYVDVYTKEGVKTYKYVNNHLLPTGEEEKSYLSFSDGSNMKWKKLPLLVFRYNEDEQVLLNRIKSLQDGINLITSTFENNMLEDARDTILVVENFDGTNPGELRHNLSTYGTIQIRNTEGGKGGVSTLKLEINSENYKIILEQFKKALIKGMKSVDVEDLKSGTPNQMNIQSMFSEIDQDATNMENEMLKTLDDMLWFIDIDIALKGQGNFENEKVNIIFNRDMLQDETSIIDNTVKLIGLVSDETLLAQIPFIDDPAAENDRVKKQREEEQPEEFKMGYGGNDKDKVEDDEE